MHPSTAEAVSVIAQFLESLYERQDLAEHLDCYHPDAWVLLGESIVRRSELDGDSYVAAISELATTAVPGAGGRPAVFEIAGDAMLTTAGSEGLLIVSMRDRTRDMEFEAVYHLRPSDGRWLLIGCTVPTPGQPTPTLATIEAAIASELAQASLVPEHRELVLTPLDLAYRRAFPREELVLLSLPETRFTCQNTGQCCRSDWGISVPKTARQALEAVDWKAIEPAITAPYFQLTLAEDAREPDRIVHRDGDCTFHQGDTCVIHQTVGYAPLPVCSTFPVGFTATPEGVCLWTSFTCPTVQANIGEPLSARYADMAARVRMRRRSMHAVADRVMRQSAGDEVSYSLYQAFEDGTLELLARTELSPHERVMRAVSAANDFASSPYGMDEQAARAIPSAAEPASGTPCRTWDGFEALGLILYLVLNKCLPSAFSGSLAVLTDPEKLSLPERLVQSGVVYDFDQDLITRYLRQIVFRKKYLPDLGVVGHINLLAWTEALVRYAAIALAVSEQRSETQPADLAAGIKAVEQACYHSQLLSENAVHHHELGPLLRSLQGGITR